jgi:hypothetical protein
VAYDIIPLLTLISSSVNLIVNIVGRLYQATNRMRELNISNYKTPNDDTPGDTENFGDLADVQVVGNTGGEKDRGIFDDERIDENVEKTEKTVKTDEKIEKTDEKTEEIEKIEIMK